MNTLLGWTFEQWAVAAGETHPLALPPRNFQGARRLQQAWRNRNEEPAKAWLMVSGSGVPIERRTDFEWAKGVFLDVVTQYGSYLIR